MARKEKTYLHQNSKPVKSSLVGKMFVNKEIDEFDEFYVNDKAKGIVDLYNEDELVWEVIASDDDAKKRMEQLTRNSSEKKHAISPLQKFMKTMNLSKEDNVSSGVNEKKKEIKRLNAKLERQEKAIGYLNDQNKEIYAALNRIYTDFQILLNLVKQEEKKLSPEDKTSYSKLLNKVNSLANGVLKEKMENFGFLNKGEVFRIQSEKALILKEKGVSQELQQKALEAKAELDLLEATREDIEKKQNELKEGANDLDARRKELDAEEEKQKAKREKLDAEEQRLAKLEEKLSALAEKLNSDQDKQKTRQSELDARETAVKEKEEKQNKFEALIADLEAKAQRLTAEVDQLEERRKNLDQSSIKTVTENVRQECRNRFALEKKALEEKASKEKTIREAQFEQEKAKWMGELNLQTEKNAQLTAQIQALDTAKKELDAKKKDLDELEQKLEQYKAELRKQGRAQEECRKKQLKREEEQNKRADDLNEMLKRIQAGSKYCSLCGTELKGGRCPKCWSKNQPN